MRDKVKVTVIATGFRRSALPVTPVDLSNYRFGEATAPSASTPQAPQAPAAAPAQAAATAPVNPSSFYRKTPQHPLAAPTGTDTSNLDVPTFLRKQGNG